MTCLVTSFAHFYVMCLHFLSLIYRSPLSVLQTQIGIAVYFCHAENFNILYSGLKNLLFIAFEFCVMHKKASPTLRI